jgi:hypothetical protein
MPQPTWPAPAAGGTWPTPLPDVATPVATPRETPDSKRSAARPVNGYPSNGAAGRALAAPRIDGAPVPVWPPEPAGEPLPPTAVFAGAPSVDDGSMPAFAIDSAPGMTDAPVPASRRSSSARPRLSRPKLPRLTDLKVDLPDNLADWLVAVGSGVALVALLLPWSNTVVGAKNLGGYTDSWGLAVPSHLIVAGVLAAVLALAVMPNPIPSWVRTGLLGVLGVLVGGLLIGLVWPYLVGGFGAGLGVFGETIAAVLLAAGGILERRGTRHEDAPTLV